MGEKMTPCAECGMPCEAGEYHPYAACLMFKGCHNSATVRANLTQPAQAVDVGAEWRPFYASVIQSLAVLARARTTDDGPREAILRDTVMGEVVRIRAALDRFSKTMRTAALPNAIGNAQAVDAGAAAEGWVLVPAEAGDTDAFMVLHEYQQPGRTRKDAYRIAIRKLSERARAHLAATPVAPAEGDGKEGVR